MSAQRARSAVTADHRSAYPNLPGLPWWAAIVVAALTTAVGIAFDAGSGGNELTDVFAALYVLGCFTAVLAVQQSSVFTAVIQPPLILFCAVPAAYWVFHGTTFADTRAILINCGYPLIERFPLMLFTSAGVLLIGMTRWYFGMMTRPATPVVGEKTTRPGRVASTVKRLTVKLVAVFRRDPARAGAAPAAPRRQRSTGRPGRPSRSASAPRGSGSTKHAAPARSRHTRPPADDRPNWEADHPRRRRPAPARGEAPPPPRRRPRSPQTGARHAQPARDTRRDPHRDTGRSATRGTRMDAYRPVERSGPPPSEPPAPPRRRAPNTAAGGRDVAATHHPISQVRYRRPDLGDESGAEPPARSNRPRRNAAESWEYDI